MKGLNTKISNPPAKFAKAPYIAKPIARATPAIIAAIVVISTPILSRKVRKRIIFNTQLTKLIIKCAKV